MLAKKLLEARRARYIPVRDVLARIVSELNCTEAEAAAVLGARLDDAGEGAPAWFDTTGLGSGYVAEKLDSREGLNMLEAFNLPRFPCDPRVTLAELHDRYRSGELDYVDYMDGRLRSLPYEVGCFLVVEIEPILLELVAEARLLAKTPSGPVDLTVADDAPPSKTRKQRTNIPPELRKTILDRCRRGEKHGDIARDYGLVRDTVSQIARDAKKKAKLLAIASPFPFPRQ